MIHATPAYSAAHIQTEPFPKEKVILNVLSAFFKEVEGGREGGKEGEGQPEKEGGKEGGKGEGRGPRPVYLSVQRWLYAQTFNAAKASFGWEEGGRVGACGDGWQGKREGGREGGVMEGIERAWLSGTRLGEAMLNSLEIKKDAK